MPDTTLLQPRDSAPDGGRYTGKHRRVPAYKSRLARWHRFLVFGGIGLVVFAAGTGLQWLLIRPLGAHWSYILQTAMSVELSYALNRRLTWRDRNTPVITSLIKWNAQLLVLTVAKIIAYDLLLRAGMNWLTANITATAAFTVVSYAVADRWSFTITRGRHKFPLVKTIRGYWLLPLLAVIGVQVGLALQLIWSNTAFQDEALYLWAGHLEWANWLHGTSIPAFATYFSGAPVIYPPLGALADSLGGLAGARLLSMCFMLGATVLLWLTARRLYGELAAFFAAASWAVLGPTLHLSAFATFDAMAMFLVALAAYLATARRAHQDAAIMMGVAAGVLALANATTYSTIIFDPVIALLAIVSAWPQPGGKAAMRRGVLIGVVTFAAVYAALYFAGAWYKDGVDFTVLSRQPGAAAPSEVLTEAFRWTGVVCIAAVSGVFLAAAVRSERRNVCLLGVCAGAALLVPLEQARIHTDTSLDKHADIGVWFAAIAVGYAVSKLVAMGRPAILRAAVASVALAGLAVMTVAGFTQGKVLFGWPDTAKYLSVVRPLIASSHGSLLVETDSVPEYYLPAGHDWQRWSSTFGITLISGKSVGDSGRVSTPDNPAVYEALIKRRYFSLIILDSSGAVDPAFNQTLLSYLKTDSGYRIIRTVRYSSYMVAPIWERVNSGAKSTHGKKSINGHRRSRRTSATGRQSGTSSVTS